jgi:hypothetical protein
MAFWETIIYRTPSRWCNEADRAIIQLELRFHLPIGIEQCPRLNCTHKLRWVNPTLTVLIASVQMHLPHP